MHPQGYHDSECCPLSVSVVQPCASNKQAWQFISSIIRCSTTESEIKVRNCEWKQTNKPPKEAIPFQFDAHNKFKMTSPISSHYKSGAKEEEELFFI